MSLQNLSFKWFGASIQGARPYQEDCSQVWRPNAAAGSGDDRPVLAVLADGMGGHVSGEVASSLACTNFIDRFAADKSGLDARLDLSLEASNVAIEQAIKERETLNGMGCTIVGVYIDQEGVRWVSVGDSPLLLYRDGILLRLNEDHSLGALLDRHAEAQVISPEEAKNSPRRRALRSALTGGPIPLKHTVATPHTLQPGDWVLLASDGLETLSGDEIASLVMEHEKSEPRELVEFMLKSISRRGVHNQDNATLIAVRVGEASSGAA